MGRKVFNFIININGVDQFAIQEIDPPEVEVGQVKHGAYNYDKKTAGGVAVGNAVLRKIKSLRTTDRSAMDWLMAAQDYMNGTGGLPEDYQQNITIKELGPRGNVLNVEIWENAWCCKIKKGTFKRGNQNENITDELTICLDRVIPAI